MHLGLVSWILFQCKYSGLKFGGFLITETTFSYFPKNVRKSSFSRKILIKNKILKNSIVCQ